MRILCVTGEYTTWSERFIARDLRTLAARGHEILVWSCARRLREARWCDISGEPLPPLERGLPAGAGRRALAALAACGLPQARRLALVLRAACLAPWRPQAVWAQFAGLPAVAGVGLARTWGARLLVSTHARDVWVPWRPGLRALSQAAGVSCCNACALCRLEGLLSAGGARPRLVRHAVSLPPDPGETGWRRRDPHLILACGRFVAKKGFDLLLRALPAVREQVPAMRLELVGAGPGHLQYGRLLQELGLVGCVRIRPRMDETALQERLRAAAVLAAPARVAPDGDRDGVPNIVLEAMAGGVPVVAGDAGGLREVVRPGETGWLVEPDHPAALATALSEALLQRRRARAMAAAARALVREEFAPARTAAALERLLAGGR